MRAALVCEWGLSSPLSSPPHPPESHMHLQVQCLPGQWSPAGSQGPCSVCPAGQFGLGLGLGCAKCRLGTWSPGGTTACAACNAGMHSGLTSTGWGTASCAGACPGGQYGAAGTVLCALVSTSWRVTWVHTTHSVLIRDVPGDATTLHGGTTSLFPVSPSCSAQQGRSRRPPAPPRPQLAPRVPCTPRA